jgi:tetratricopeptide (TPR) repeat protein
MWALETMPAGSWAQGTTPREVASVVRKIQRFDPQARTISTELSAEQARSMRSTAEEVEAETEELVRQKIRAGLGTAADYRAIANVLSHRREHAEAERYARAAVAADAQSAEMWECLGLVLYKRDDFSGAREALEGAIALDGRRVLALEALAACYIRLGDDARAREIRSRANSITGGAFQG